MKQTSRAAHEFITREGIDAHHRDRILSALERIGEGNAYEISLHIAGLDKYQCGKRMKELCAAKLIEPTGEKRKTDTSCKGNVYRLVKRQAA